jgi:hypothetical protein
MLGKTLFSKICNSIVLILLLGYATVKVLPLLGVEFATEIISKEVVNINSEPLLDHNALQEKLSSFQMNKEKLSVALSKENITLEEFFQEVELEFVIPKDLPGNKSITLEFISSSKNYRFSTGYKNIAMQIYKHIND